MIDAQQAEAQWGQQPVAVRQGPKRTFLQGRDVDTQCTKRVYETMVALTRPPHEIGVDDAHAAIMSSTTTLNFQWRGTYLHGGLAGVRSRNESVASFA